MLENTIMIILEILINQNLLVIRFEKFYEFLLIATLFGSLRSLVSQCNILLYVVCERSELSMTKSYEYFFDEIKKIKNYFSCYATSFHSVSKAHDFVKIYLMKS
jgi:hypothetical protein